MEKAAPAQYPIHELIARRWSPVAFADRPVNETTLRQLFEAARWAPSCFNDQPWFYLVATRENPDAYQKMLACLVEGNQAWAKAAPVLMISVARMNFRQTGKPNRHAFHDVGAASAMLCIQATALGLAVHQMGGFDVDAARRTYAVPADCEPVAAIALGYAGDPASLPEKLRQRELAPRARLPLEEMVFAGTWGSTAHFLVSGGK
jgi:nitroreductase